MKKAIFCLFALGLSFLFMEFTQAATWECDYTYKGGAKLLIEIDNVNGTIKNKEEKKNSLLQTYTYKYEVNSEEIKNYKSREDGQEKNDCPLIFVVEDIVTNNVGGSSGISVVKRDYYFTYYTDSYLRQNRSECVEEINDFCLSNFFGETIHYYTATLSDSETNNENTEVSTCPKFETFSGEIKNNYSLYSTCTGNDCYKYISEANKNIEKIKDYCKQALKYRDAYIESSDGSKVTQEACIKVCLSIEDELIKLKDEYNIEQNSNGECGLSNNLLVWLLNIVKWVKYIIPVIVIVMGILDFMRAVASDKDDGMKQAQSRFIKRLIAAALIFIVPFILEFILDKMGFSVEGCNIFDL